MTAIAPPIENLRFDESGDRCFGEQQTKVFENHPVIGSWNPTQST